MKYIISILILSLIFNWCSLNAQNKADIQKLCDGQLNNTACADCQGFLLEGWEAANLEKNYGKAIERYTRASTLGYVAANSLINQLKENCMQQLFQLRRDVIRQVKELEKQNQTLEELEQKMKGTNNSIAIARDSLKDALQTVHAKGMVAETYRLPYLADSLRSNGEHQDAAYLAYYSILLQQDSLDKKDDIQSPAWRALMEAGAVYDELSSDLISVLLTDESIEMVEILANGNFLIQKNTQIFLQDDAETVTLATKLQPPFQLWISPRKQHLVVADTTGQIEFWKVSEQKPLKHFQKLSSSPSICKFATDHSAFVVANRNGEMLVYDWKTLQTNHFSTEGDRIYGLDISPKAKLLLTRSAKGKARIWKTDGTLLQTVGQGEVYLHHAQFSYPNGQEVLTTNTLGQVKVWELYKETVKTIYSAADSISIKSVISLGQDHWLLRTAHLILIRNGDTDIKYEFDKRVLNVKVDKQNELALVWSVGGELFLIDLRTQLKLRLPKQKSSIVNADFSPDRQWIVSTSTSGDVQMSDNKGNLILDWQLNTKRPTPLSAKFSEEGTHLILINKTGKSIRKCPLPAQILDKLKLQKSAILKHLKQKRVYNLQYLGEV